MSRQAEGSLQARLQTLIKQRGGYIPNKSHGSMITAKGISDLRFTYKGLAVHWEVKLPEEAHNVSEAQGIHCRLAKKAGGITAIITSLDQGRYILDLIDEYAATIISFHDYIKFLASNNIKIKEWDDGTSY